MQKLLRAQENHKRGPFSLAGGVQVHIWEDWLLIVPAGHRFADRRHQAAWRWWSRAEFYEVFETRLLSSAAPALAPFWVAFPAEQNTRNVLVKAGEDASWPILTGDPEVAVISAFKLLKRWRDADVRLPLSPLW